MARASTAFTRIACCALLLSSGCTSRQEEEVIIAQVGDAVLNASDLESLLSTGGDLNVQEPDQMALVQNWMQEELLYQEALERKLEQGVRIQKLLEQARRDLLVAALLDREFDGREVDLNETALNEYYDLHREEFLRSRPEIWARHILAGSQRDANKVHQELDQGASFEELARQHSLDEDTKLLSGDMGYFSQEDDPILWEICYKMPLNILSKPQQTEYGYHIIQVLDRQEAGTFKELGQVRDQVVESLVRQEYRRRLDEFVGRLKSTRKWIVHDASSARSSKNDSSSSL